MESESMIRSGKQQQIISEMHQFLPQPWSKRAYDTAQTSRFWVIVILLLIGSGIAAAFISHGTWYKTDGIIIKNPARIIVQLLSWDTTYVTGSEDSNKNWLGQRQSMNNNGINDNKAERFPQIQSNLGLKKPELPENVDVLNNNRRSTQNSDHSMTLKTDHLGQINKRAASSSPSSSGSGNVIYQTLILDYIYPYGPSERKVISANYSYPGPPITATEGDTLVIKVINKLNAPTTLHWHGISQQYTPGMDGAVGVTQCAIPPNDTMTYTFVATPGGTTWYHGHLLEQYTDGLFGPLIIHEKNEPYQSKYDSEQVLMVADWYNLLAHDQLLPYNQHGILPEPDAIVVNGKFTESLYIPLTKTSRVRFRFINSAALSMYNVSMDGLPMHIIEIDQLDVVTYTVNSFVINVGQRVSCYIDMSELDPYYSSSGASPTGSIFIRFQSMLSMYPVDITQFIIPYETQRYAYPTFYNPLYLAILSFNGTNSAPSYQPNQATPTVKNAVTPSDTNLLDARPYNSTANKVLNATYSLNLTFGFAVTSNGTFEATINGVPYSSDANYMSMRPDPTTGITSDLYSPVLHQMATKPNGLNIPAPAPPPAGSKLPLIQSDGYAHYGVPYQAVVAIFLNNTDSSEHPFHLHGHKFWIISTSAYPQAETLYAGNYLQRDTVSVPAMGWAKIRYVANKPGAWMFHCHIEWHMAVGLALIFVTSPQQLLAQGYTIPSDQVKLCQDLKLYNQNLPSTK